MRKKQKGIECSVDGCTGWCVSNDMCPKCNMRAYRATPEGKASTKAYNQRYKRPDIEKVCDVCHDTFLTARESQVSCSSCSGSYAARKAKAL